MNTKTLTRLLKALANERRLLILRYIKKRRSASVSDIANAMNLSLRSTSKHLSLLSNVDIIKRRQRGREVYYRISLSQETVTRHIVKTL